MTRPNDPSAALEVPRDVPRFGRQNPPAKFAWLQDVYAWGPLAIEFDGRLVTCGAHYLRRYQPKPAELVLQWEDGEERDHLISGIRAVRRLADGIEIRCRDKGGDSTIVVRPAKDKDWPGHSALGVSLVQWFNQHDFDEAMSPQAPEPSSG